MCLTIIDSSRVPQDEWKSLSTRTHVYKCMDTVDNKYVTGYVSPFRPSNYPYPYKLGDVMVASEGPSAQGSETLHGIYVMYDEYDVRDYAKNNGVSHILLCEVEPKDLLHIGFVGIWSRQLAATYRKVKLVQELSNDYGRSNFKARPSDVFVRSGRPDQSTEGTTSGD